MRADLNILEKIDSYLSGDLSKADQISFEQEIANNPDLASAVAKQEELIKVVNRQALRAQINSVAIASAAGGTAGLSKAMLGVIGGGFTVLVAVIAFVYVGNDDELIAENTTPNSAPDIPVQNRESLNTEIEEYIVEDGLILEEPETIFSSTQAYEEDEGLEDKMNVTVNFRQYERNEDDKGSKNTEQVVLEKQLNNLVAEPLIEPAKPEIKNRTARAHYPGGNVAMKTFIDKNLRYPISARDKGIECVIRCDFHVTAEGRITEIIPKCIKMSEQDGELFSDVRIMLNKKLLNSFIGNATHILRTMPIWEPARNSDGNPVVSAQRMYFNYDLKRGCLVYQLDDEVIIIREESPANKSIQE